LILLLWCFTISEKAFIARAVVRRLMRGQLPFNLLERCLKFFPIQGKDLTCVVCLGRRRSHYSADPRKIRLRTFADHKGRARTFADFKREGHEHVQI
jgi:hypothetical protein